MLKSSSRELKEETELVSTVTATLTSIVQQIVSVPNDVRIEVHRQARETTFFLHVAPADLERMLASGGRTLRSLRSVTDALAARWDSRIRLEIVDSTNDLHIL